MRAIIAITIIISLNCSMTRSTQTASKTDSVTKLKYKIIDNYGKLKDSYLELIVSNDKQFVNLVIDNKYSYKTIRDFSKDEITVFVGLRDSVFKFPEMWFTNEIKNKEVNEKGQKKLLEYNDWGIDSTNVKILKGFSCDYIYNNFSKKSGNAYQKIFVTHELEYLEKLKNKIYLQVPGFPLEAEMFNPRGQVHLIQKIENFEKNEMNNSIFELESYSITKERASKIIEEIARIHVYPTPTLMYLFGF